MNINKELSKTTEFQNYDILNLQDVCQLLNMKTSRIRCMIFKKQIPHFKIGGSIRFNRLDLIKWIENQRVPTK